MAEREYIEPGKWTIEDIDALIRQAALIQHAGERIEFLSHAFLGIPYLANTLESGLAAEETFVINLAGVDCFTFIDYVEAMRLSASFDEFRENLKGIRYRGGAVAYERRNHFFTDWIEFNNSVTDATRAIGLDKTKTAGKELNRKADGTYYLPGIKPTQRDISYIPASLLDGNILSRMETGDYIGIYSELDGLDVSHVGIFIRLSDGLFMRHASSRREIRRVIDQDFAGYVKSRPGIIVLRPKG
ncbi:MAG TPA: N-acetylmuramoyl-L-alanine amidase-like domain-containing protein [Dissulfurispiraceae bacterium]|nr:N-acetylmuramoyl-L-alanine amidase-like domain-containing protein [Dissulfurispiraceae bacterium]